MSCRVIAILRNDNGESYRSALLRRNICQISSRLV
jgi:hypothetical protein